MRLRTSVIAILFASILPAIAWAAFKPIRVLAPELLGLDCSQAGICMDDVTMAAEAVSLQAAAMSFVEAQVGHIANPPRFIFCSKSKCAKSFGFTNEGAYHVGTYGVVIGPRGWKPYFVRHELIHHLQMERLGSMHALLSTPTWFIEGMAYSMSQDPRRPLPEPLQGWRSKFELWYSKIEPQSLWLAAEKL